MEYIEQNNSQNTNEGISFLELLSLVKKNLVLILVVTVLFTACGAIYGKFVKKPVYSATATAVIQVDNSSLSEYNAFVYAQYLVNSMSEFIISDNVTKEVAKELIDEQYEISHTEKENSIVHYSNKEQKEITEQNYQKMITSKANAVKSGTKITTKDESLIIKITYSKEEENENTPGEVLKTVGLIIEKTQEVAKTYKNQTPTRKFPVAESENAIMYAYEKKYNLTPVKDAEGNIISYVGDKSFTALELNDIVKNEARILRNNFVVYYDGDSLVLAIKTTEESQELDSTIASHSLVYLNDYALKNPVEKYVEEYLYPVFANKLVEMNNQPTFATKSTKTLIITVIAFILGAAVSFGVILLRYLLDDTFKSRTQLEAITGINVLASIPKFNAKEDE